MLHMCYLDGTCALKRVKLGCDNFALTEILNRSDASKIGKRG